MLVYNKYLKKLGLKKKDYYVFRKGEDKRYRLNKKIGLVPAEVWNLDTTLILQLYTYISQFMDQSEGCCPGYFNSYNEWKDTLEKIRDGFKRYILYFIVEKGKEYDEIKTLERSEQYKREEEIGKAVLDSLDLIKEHFFSLWY